MGFEHISVMPNECIAALDIKPYGCYLDATAGGAGHSYLIAQRLTTGRLISADRDIEAVRAARARLAELPCAEVIQASFSELPAELARLGITGLDGILADFGVSSHQIDTAERGFSYMKDAPLDMRMSQTAGATAADLVNTATEQELAKILFEYGEEKNARAIASAIVRARAKKPIERTLELVSIVDRATPRGHSGHSSKRTFQALRIAVNNELEQIADLLSFAVTALNRGGRLAVLTFHSLEDRLVKRFFAELCISCRCPADFPVCVCGAVTALNRGGRLAVLTFHSLEDRLVKRFFAELCISCRCPADFPVCVCGGKAVARQLYRGGLTATEQELLENPRSHSARLRAVHLVQMSCGLSGLRVRRQGGGKAAVQGRTYGNRAGAFGKSTLALGKAARCGAALGAVRPAWCSCIFRNILEDIEPVL